LQPLLARTEPVTLRQQDGAGERESRASVVDRAVALPSLPRGAQGILLCATPGGGQRDLVGTANGRRVSKVVEIADRDDWPQAHLLTIPDHTYDFLQAEDVLQRVDQPAEALANWIRVLKPGGVLALAVPDDRGPSDAAWRVTLQEPDQPKGHVNLLELIQVVCHLVEIDRIERVSEGGPLSGRSRVEAVLRKRHVAITPVQSNRAPEILALAKLTEVAVEQRDRWRPMQEFRDILASGVEAASVVDISRLYLLYQWLGTTLGLEGECIEVGSYRGGTAKLVSEMLLRHRPEVELHLFDTFEGMPEQLSLDEVGMRGAFADTSLQQVQRLLANNPMVSLHQGIFPASMPKGFDTKRFRFAHIDVDIESSVLDCLAFIYPRMVPGGVIVIDDYGHPNCPGATRAVEQFFRNAPHRVVQMPLRSSAVVIKPHDC
jgi:O-methyltransferase